MSNALYLYRSAGPRLCRRLRTAVLAGKYRAQEFPTFLPTPWPHLESCAGTDTRSGKVRSLRAVPSLVEVYQLSYTPRSEDHRGTPAAPGRVVTLLTRDFWATLTDAV